MSIVSELRTVMRSLQRAPGYSLAVIATLALGIGANAAIFSVVDAVLLRPLPYEDPDRVVRLRERTRFSQSTPVSPNQVAALRQRVGEWATLETLDSLVFNLVGPEGAERIPGAAVSPGFLRMLGVRPHLGRDFSNDAEAAASDEVLLGHALWQSRFAGRADVLGQQIEMHWSAPFGPGRDLPRHFTVIGVLPQDFLPPFGRGELFVPSKMPQEPGPSNFNYLFPFARLQNRDLASAETMMSQVIAAMPPPQWRSPEDQLEVGIALRRVGEASVARVRSALWILWSAVGLVLLAACANVANLMLTRNTRRRREIGIRQALGASRVRLWRWLLTESLLLAGAAAACGLVLAWGGIRLLHSLAPNFLPRLQWIAVDQRMLFFALLSGLATVIVFGMLPALEASRSPGIGSGRSNSASRSVRRLGAGLVVAQVALSVLLVAGATQLVGSFRHLLDIDLGFDPEHLATFEVSLPAAQYPEREQREGFQRRVLESVGALPGVKSAALSSGLPLTLVNTATRIVLPAATTQDAPPPVSYRAVSEGFFQTFGVPLLGGRLFEPGDISAEPKAVLVNRTLAELLWPDGNPIGETVSLTSPGVEDATIIGVVADVRQSGPIRDIRPTAFIPSLGTASFGVVLRLDDQATVSRQQLAAAVTALDPAQPIHAYTTFDSPQDRWLGRPMFNAWMMSLFGGLALTVAVLGLLAVLSFSVSRRTAEIGLRQALGARAGDILSLIAREGLRLVFVGAACGLGLALASTQWIASLLHGVEPSDPALLAAAALIALVVAAPAILLPARRAAAVAPAVALRSES